MVSGMARRWMKMGAQLWHCPRTHRFSLSHWLVFICDSVGPFVPTTNGSHTVFFGFWIMVQNAIFNRDLLANKSALTAEHTNLIMGAINDGGQESLEVDKYINMLASHVLCICVQLHIMKKPLSVWFAVISGGKKARHQPTIRNFVAIDHPACLSAYVCWCVLNRISNTMQAFSEYAPHDTLKRRILFLVVQTIGR